MLPSDKLLIEAAYASWAARDLEAVMACFAEDVAFIIHLPTEVAPFFGELRGRQELLPRFRMIFDEYDFLSYHPIGIVSQGIAFHSQVRFHYRHKLTGLEYDGTMRHVWRVKGDQIMRFEEFHDSERVRAFFKLLEEAKRSLAADDKPPCPGPR
jgi:ketosteroid isomerase-like protein